MAAYAARGGMRSLVLVPEGKISRSKLSQALDYGAVTCQLRTDFDGCLRLLQELVLRAPVYQLNSINPFRLEGQKTLALELMEQLDWQPPDHIIVPGGNLGNSSAIGKALLEMRDLGLIPRLPKLSVIQAEGANALVRTLREASGKRLVSVQAETRATAIRIGNPASWKKAVHVLEATGGACEQVTEAGRLLVGSRPLPVFGLRAGAALAGYFGYFAAKIHPDVRVLDHGGTLLSDRLEQAASAGATAMLAIVLPRYPREALDALREARSAGLAVVLLTDSPISPAAGCADVTLSASVGARLVFDLQAAPMALAMVLLQAMCDAAPAATQARLEQFESSAARRGVFVR